MICCKIILYKEKYILRQFFRIPAAGYGWAAGTEFLNLTEPQAMWFTSGIRFIILYLLTK